MSRESVPRSVPRRWQRKVEEEEEKEEEERGGRRFIQSKEMEPGNVRATEFVSCRCGLTRWGDTRGEAM